MSSTLPIPSRGPSAHHHLPSQASVVRNNLDLGPLYLFQARIHHIIKSTEGPESSVCATSHVWANLVAHNPYYRWYVVGYYLSISRSSFACRKSMLSGRWGMFCTPSNHGITRSTWYHTMALKYINGTIEVHSTL
ncbi:hypothetical protein PIB30_045643 [Stylosanthes scabra]|uniref:Uncharacterized protein n=1 Tax=Stylosanthes scabra TaxID=79078 RepID=A0ABU6WEK4_9FABA|nr:hypothetical protein [Stylosanthes scabra]